MMAFALHSPSPVPAIPWAVAAIAHLGRQPGLFRMAVAGGAVAALILAGHPQIAVYGLGVVVAAGAWVVFTPRLGWIVTTSSSSAFVPSRVIR